MHVSKKYLAGGSALLLAALISLGTSQAETKMKPGMQPPSNQNPCADDVDCAPGGDGNRQYKIDKQKPDDAQAPGKDWSKKQKNVDQDNSSGGNEWTKKRKNVDRDNNAGGKDWNNKNWENEQNQADQGIGKRQANKNWQYDPGKHHRRKYKDDRYRYNYGGYWYLEPYWTFPIYGYPGRMSCGEGRDIVYDRGFHRVRIINCSGKYYSYAGRRYGDSFKIVVNARNGKIVSVRPL